MKDSWKAGLILGLLSLGKFVLFHLSILNFYVYAIIVVIIIVVIIIIIYYFLG